MGYIPSAETLTAVAYLTDRGREYLFNQGNIRFDANGNDLFQVVQFALGDPDANYTAIQNNNNAVLSTGEVPDISGKSEGCLKTAVGYSQNNLLIYEIVENNTPANVEYLTNLTDDINGQDGVTVPGNDIPTTTEQPPVLQISPIINPNLLGGLSSAL
jgi:hypothetical protein